MSHLPSSNRSKAVLLTLPSRSGRRKVKEREPPNLGQLSFPLGIEEKDDGEVYIGSTDELVAGAGDEFVDFTEDAQIEVVIELSGMNGALFAVPSKAERDRPLVALPRFLDVLD